MNRYRNDPEFLKLFDQVFQLKNKEDHNGARRALLKIVRKWPDAAAAYGVLGGECYLLGRYSEAAKYFERNTMLSPRSELASTGLFHSLWKIGKKAAAINEIRRFTASHPSEEYELIKKEFGIASEVSSKLPSRTSRKENPVERRSRKRGRKGQA